MTADLSAVQIHPQAVVDAKAQFTRALYRISVFADQQQEVEALFQRLVTWTEVKSSFVQFMRISF